MNRTPIQVPQFEAWPTPTRNCIRIALRTKRTTDFASLVQMSSGAVSASTTLTDAWPYKSAAFIPREPWRELPNELADVIIGNDIYEPRCGLIEVDQDVLEDLERIKVDFPPEQAAITGIPRERLSPLLTYLERELEACEPSIVHGAVWDRPGLETVTYNPRSGHFLGLHLDSWDAKTLEERLTARTRICVNLGPAVRSFVFVPIRLLDIEFALQRINPVYPRRQADELIPAFFATFDAVPVIRLNVKPGTAYFADTDNMLHDGSSKLANLPSLHYTIRGRFAAFARPSAT